MMFDDQKPVIKKSIRKEEKKAAEQVAPNGKADKPSEFFKYAKSEQKAE